MGDDEAKVLADAKKLSYSDRVAHKNWKVRSEAFEDVRTGCSRASGASDTIVQQAGSLFATGVGDSNANVMDKALDALCSWLQVTDENRAARQAPDIMSTLASKCLKARPATVAKASDACLLFIELEQSMVVIDALIVAFDDKVPKTVIAALDVVIRAVNEFGAKGVDPKFIIKALPKVYGHSNAGVRERAKDLTVALAACTGQGVVESTLMSKMNDAMKKDVETSIAALPTRKKKPERYTRREQATMQVDDGADEEGAEDGGTAASSGVQDMEIDGGADPYDYADPVDVLGQLYKTQVSVGDDTVSFWECFGSKKWNVRKAALDKVKEVANVPKIKNGDFGQLTRELKKVLDKDANVNCAAAAADASGALANGLRNGFSNHAKILCPGIIERFKEKHPGMSRAADESLRAMGKHCYSVTDVQEDLAAALAHKNPKVRLDTLRLLKDMIDDSPKAQAQRSKDGLLPAVATSAADADGGIREAAQGVLVAYAQKLGGYNSVQSFLTKLDDAKCKLIETAIASAKPSGGAPAAAPKRAAPAAAASRSAPASKPPAAAGARAPTTRSAAASPRQKPAAKPTAPRPATRSAAPVDDEASLNAGRLSGDELEERMLQLFGGEVVEGLRSPQWQARLEAVTTMSERAQEIVAEDDSTCGILVQCVAHLPGWGDKNFQVLNKVFEIITALASSSAGYGKKEAALAIEGLQEKIHELKHRIQVCDALTASSEAVGPGFVAAQLHKRAAANKNPKVLSEALSWIATAVEEFGVAAMSLPLILEWTIADLASPNAPVRNQAMAVLGKCHAQVGGALLAQLEGLKPAQLTAIEEIFRKHPKQADYAPTRKMRSKSGAGKKAAAASGAGQADDVDMDEEEDDQGPPVDLSELLPRADVTGHITPLVAKIGSSNWKERNAALDDVEQILKEAGGRIKPAPNDLYPALRGRMTDTNRNLAAKALLLLAKLAEATGAPFDKQARPALSAALANLSDNKKQVRDAVFVMLDAWLATSAPDRLFPALMETLCNPKCMIDGRAAGLHWMSKVVSTAGGAPKCLDSALKAALIASVDKSGAVRDGGMALLQALIQTEGPDAVQRTVRELDAPSKKAASEVLAKAIAAAGGSQAAAPAASSRSAAASATSRPGTGGASAAAAAVAASSAVAGRSMRSGTTAAAQAAPADDSTDQPILAMSSSKPARTRQTRPRAGRFEGIAPDEADSLEAALSAVASDDFRALLFSKDFKKHLEAADMLADATQTLLAEIAASLDLLLRWAVVRICDNNMQSLVKVLETVRILLDALAADSYRMTDAEATLFLPCLIEKWGHNQDRVRALHREVLRSVCAIYPSAKVMEQLTQGLGSKNARTRIECCEEIASILEDEGGEALVACRAKPVQALGALLKERDGSVRAAALTALEAVWAHEGADYLWKALGRLETREKDMVEEKLRRSQRSAGSEQPRGTRASPAAVNTPAGGAYGDDSPAAMGGYSRAAFTPPNALETPTRSGGGSGNYGGYGVLPSAVPTPVPGGYSGGGGAPMSSSPAATVEDQELEARWEANLNLLHQSQNLPEVIEAMKQLCTDIMLVTAGRASDHSRAVMGASAERLFTGVNRQLNAIFAAAEQEAALTGADPSSRGAKYALNVMLQGMSVQEIALGLPQATLRVAVCALLLRLLDDGALLRFDEGSTLVKAVNVLMLKILEAGNRTYCFAALLHLLREPPREVTPETAPKFYDLVVKCLIKLTKGLQTTTEGVDLAALLFSLHDFFMFLGVDEIRKRSSSDDKPLRMVKTILHELCKIKGYGIYNYTAGIPGRHASPQPIIFAYIQLNLSSLQQNGVIQPPPEGFNVNGGAAGAGSREAQADDGAYEAEQAKQQALADAQKAEVKQRLKDIMTRLVQRDPAAQQVAMEELYRLRESHRSYVDRYIAGTSDMFRQFIDSGLAKLEAQGGVAPSPEYAGSPYSKLSPRVASGGGGEQSARISGLRDRLSTLRASGEGVSSTPSPPPGSYRSMPSAVGAHGGGGDPSRLSVEQLAAKMAALRKSGSAIVNRPGME